MSASLMSPHLVSSHRCLFNNGKQREHWIATQWNTVNTEYDVPAHFSDGARACCPIEMINGTTSVRRHCDAQADRDGVA